MNTHIFLTGPKQIGKSTVIQRCLALCPRSCSGFLTVKSTSVYPGARSVHMLDAAQKKKPSEENFLFFCGRDAAPLYRHYSISPDAAPRFDRHGCALLDPLCANHPCGAHDVLHANRTETAAVTPDARLILMDEIGPHETGADVFCASILRCLDGSTPVLGVLQQADTPLFQKIVSHPQVRLIRVSAQNRDALPEQISFLL